MLSIYHGAGNQETVVMEDIAAVARSAFGAIADPHTNGDLFVSSVTAPIGFSAHTTSTVSRDPTEAIDRDVADR